MDSNEQKTVELEGIEVDEGFELSRITSHDRLKNSSSSLSSSSSQDSVTLPRVTSLDPLSSSLAVSSSQESINLPRVTSLDPLTASSELPLSSSHDTLTIHDKDVTLPREGRGGAGGETAYPEEWVFKFLGWEGEKGAVRRAIKTMFKMHLYAALCLIACGTYVAIYVPEVITQELRTRLDHNNTYVDVSRKTRLALGIGYSLHNAYVGIYGLILMMLVIGWRKLRFAVPFNVFMFCGITGFIFAYYYVESYYHKIHGFYSIIVYILIGIQILGTAGAFGYRVGHFKAVLGFTAVVTIAVLVFVGIIDYVGVPIFMDASNLGKSVFRISVVPCILVIKVVAIRAVCRFSDFSNLYMNTDGGGTLSFTIALIPVFVRAFYGRIFYLNVPTLGNLAWNAILVEVFDIGFKLAHWNRRYALKGLKPLVRKYYFLKPLIDKPSGDSFYALCLCFEKTIDILAIGYATLIYILYQSKWEDNPNYAQTIYAAIIQYLIEALAQIISFRLEHGFGIPSLTIIKKTKFWTIYPILVTTSIMIAVTCTWRGVFILHDTYWV